MHEPVLLQEVLSAFEPVALNTFVDATLGAAGHAHALLENHPELTQLIGLDQDSQARAIATERLKAHENRISVIAGNFRNLKDHLVAAGIKSVDGILMDLGVSSMQLDQAERGFSFRFDAPLDMRMDPTSGISAADLLAAASESRLEEIFRDFGELPNAKRLARQIGAARAKGTIATTKELCDLLEPLLRGKGRPGHHPLTLVFQALRIAVNCELEVLQEALPQAIACLRPGGRLAVITFHSLEDRLVKHAFQEASKGWTADLSNPYANRKVTTRLIRLVTKRPICPSREECRHNRRSRSAKLRIVERL